MSDPAAARPAEATTGRAATRTPACGRSVEDDAGTVGSTTQEATTGDRRHWRLLCTVVLVAAAVCAAVLVAVGSIARVPGSGLAALDVRVSWLLPAARLAGDLAAAATVGCLVAAAGLLPGRQFVSPAGYRWVRRATWPAGVWAVATGLMLPGLLVAFLNTDLSQVSVRAVLAFVRDTPFGAAQAAAVALALVVAVGSRWVLTTAGARGLLVLAMLAVVPPAVAEYAESEGTAAQVAIAATGMVLHIVVALTWSGALAALLLLRLPADELVIAVRRYSRVAPVLVLIVGGSGLLTAMAELDEAGQWLQTAFGRLVLLKVLALTVLVALGWWHRRRTLPALAEGRAGSFRRIAAVELVIFAATFGLAVGLSRTPDPELGVTETSSAASMSAGPNDRGREAWAL